MFADTLTVTVNTVGKVLAKINQDGYSSEYQLREAAQMFALRIRHTEVNRNGSKVDRHNVELTQTIYATESAAEIVRKVYVVIEVAKSDLDTYLATALADFCKLSSPAVLTKLNGWES